MVSLRNNSVFAHGLGPVGNHDFYKFRDFVKEIFEKLKKKNIFVRYFNKPGIDNYLRITVGTDEEMKKLYKALQEILQK